MARMKQLDSALLEAALEGLELRLAEVDRNISEVKRLMGGGPAPAAPAKAGRRKLSAAARKRISEAQKRRWAKSRARNGRKRSAEAPSA